MRLVVEKLAEEAAARHLVCYGYRAWYATIACGARSYESRTSTVPIFGRPRQAKPTSLPTTAELRDERARQWTEYFSGPSSEADYRRAFLRYSPLFWDIVRSDQRELLRVLVGRVPADIGVPAIFGLSVAFIGHAKPDEASRATLAMIVNELMPQHARTLLVCLSDAWQNASNAPYHQRGEIVAGEFMRSIRRLEGTQANADGVITSIRALVERCDEAEEGEQPTASIT